MSTHACSVDTSLPEGFLHERLLETRGNSMVFTEASSCYSSTPPALGSLIDDLYKEPSLQDLCSSFYWQQSPTPLKKKSSSLKSSKSANGEKNGEKKIVRFADVLGLDLADVHTFLDEVPRIPKSAFKDLKDKDKGSVTSLSSPTLYRKSSSSSLAGSPAAQSNGFTGRFDKTLVALFQQPTSRIDFADRLHRQKICLENAFVTNTNALNVRGTIRVVNVDYHKQVVIRHSTDKWRTHSEISASYVESCGDGGFSDRFTFTLPGNHVAVGARLELAIRYNVANEEFWDNNNGQNYCFHCVSESRQDHLYASHPPASSLEPWTSTPAWAY